MLGDSPVAGLTAPGGEYRLFAYWNKGVGMKITAVKFLVLEDPEGLGSGGHAITRVEGLRRIQYTHAGRAGGVAQPLRQNFLEVHTDAGIVGRCDTSMNAYQADIVRYHAVGRSAWEREGLFQQFLKGTRWVYSRRDGSGPSTTVSGIFWGRLQVCRSMRWWDGSGTGCRSI